VLPIGCPLYRPLIKGLSRDFNITFSTGRCPRPGFGFTYADSEDRASLSSGHRILALHPARQKNSLCHSATMHLTRVGQLAVGASAKRYAPDMAMNND